MIDEDTPNYSDIREIPWEEPGALTPIQRLQQQLRELYKELMRISDEVRDLRHQLQKHEEQGEEKHGDQATPIDNRRGADRRWEK